jgi:hypothetical protein
MHALITNSPPDSTIHGNGQEPESKIFGHSSYWGKMYSKTLLFALYIEDSNAHTNPQ